MLKLMYITNDPDVAEIADEAGVDRVWIDLESKGKELRQSKNFYTVLSKNKIIDIKKVKTKLKKSKFFIGINKIDEEA